MSMVNRKIRIDDQSEVASVWAYPPDSVQPRGGIILAHGAGAGMDHEFLSYFHQALASEGLVSVKFNFPYMEKGRKRPDPASRLEMTFRRLVDEYRREPGLPDTLFIGGKSMGGRMATHLVASGLLVSGVVLLGYPLHAPGREDRVRSSHFDRIGCPLLFLQGTRDRLCRLSLLGLELVHIDAPVRLHVVEGADHSFHVPVRSGRSQEEVRREMVSVMVSWMFPDGMNLSSEASKR